MSEYLFVYGLLRTGFDSHGRMEAGRCRLVGEATIQGALYDLGPYPALRLGEPGMVHGELYEITDPALICELDEYEGYHGRHDTCRYLREPVTARGGDREVTAWVYAYNPRRSLEGAAVVASGDYRDVKQRVG
jgi:gamma-glutamylcyclotransferase (GGCT)/AIG2-like uncharacterized protein YtfP